MLIESRNGGLDQDLDRHPRKIPTRPDCHSSGTAKPLRFSWNESTPARGDFQSLDRTPLRKTPSSGLQPRRQSLGPQGLPPAHARRVKVRPLPQADGPRPLALPEPLALVVGRRGVVRRPVVPDGHVVDVPPPVPHLQVVVLQHELHEPVEEVPRLVLREPVDPLHVLPEREHAAPPRHRVRPHHRVHRPQLRADVLRRAARGRVEGEAVALGGLLEPGLRVRRRERVEEGSERLRDAVVHLVPGGPECVCQSSAYLRNVGLEGEREPPPVLGSSVIRSSV